MGCYIYAPAGPSQLQSDILKKCIEYIGSTQAGHGSNLSKGKRYIKYELARQNISCSGTAIKRAMQISTKLFRHDFQTYGTHVYFYHKDSCAAILGETIKFIIKHSNDEVKMELLRRIPATDEYLDLLYAHRISQLQWVHTQDYQCQGSEAQDLCNKFDALQF